jgi:hypothetical protein
MRSSKDKCPALLAKLKKSLQWTNRRRGRRMLAKPRIIYLTPDLIRSNARAGEETHDTAPCSVET